MGLDGPIKPAKPGAPPSQFTGIRQLTVRLNNGAWGDFEYQFDDKTQTLYINKWSGLPHSPPEDRAKALHAEIVMDANRRVVTEKIGGRIHSERTEIITREKDQIRVREIVSVAGRPGAEITEIGYYACNLPEPKAGRIKYRRNPDGSLARYDHTKTVAGMKTTIERGSAGDTPSGTSATGPVPNLTKGIRFEILHDIYGDVDATRSFDIATGKLLKKSD